MEIVLMFKHGGAWSNLDAIGFEIIKLILLKILGKYMVW